MMKFLCGVFLAILFSLQAFAGDNIADCEIVVQQAIVSVEGTDKAPMMATFLPAEDFIFSVYDTAPGFLRDVNGKKIKAVMCTRTNIIPTEFDAKLIKTHIPFFLSTNFDSPNSPFLTFAKNQTGYSYDYSGPDLTPGEKQKIEAFIQTLNQDEVKAEHEKNTKKTGGP